MLCQFFRLFVAVIALATSADFVPAYAQASPASKAPFDKTVGQKSLESVDRMLDQTIADQRAWFLQLVRDLGSQVGPQAKAVTALETLLSVYKAKGAYKDGRYVEALQNAAEAVARVWGEVNNGIKVGKIVESTAVKMYEAQATLAQQAKLIEARYKIAKSLNKWTNGSEGQQFWTKIMSRLHGDPEMMHKAFEDSLRQNGVSKGNVLSQVMKDSGNGKVVVDPLDQPDLRNIAGLNPDFVEAMRRQKRIMEEMKFGDKGGLLARMLMDVDKYPDGSYINIMGRGRGLPPFHLPNTGPDVTGTIRLAFPDYFRFHPNQYYEDRARVPDDPRTLPTQPNRAGSFRTGVSSAGGTGSGFYDIEIDWSTLPKSIMGRQGAKYRPDLYLYNSRDWYALDDDASTGLYHISRVRPGTYNIAAMGAHVNYSRFGGTDSFRCEVVFGPLYAVVDRPIVVAPNRKIQMQVK